MKVIVVALLVLMTVSLRAEKMTIDAHSVVINKLEKALSLTGKNHVKKQSLYRRLGDLYSERARLYFLRETQDNCTKCIQSKSDRTVAISYLKKAIKRARPLEKSRMLLQVAHLYKVLPNERLRKITLLSLNKHSKRKSQKSYIAISEYELSEINYNNNQYKKAIKGYKSAFMNLNKNKRAMALYKIAWSQMNIGQIKEAVKSLKYILKSKSYLSNNGVYNKPFHVDVSRDLVTFMARRPIYKKEIIEIESLSPRGVVLDNLFYLAEETQRTGQWRSSLRVWDYYLLLKDHDASTRLEVSVRKAQIYYFIKNKKQALKHYRESLALWGNGSCLKECASIEIKFKNFIILWHKDIKNRSDKYFLIAINLYLAHFKKESGIFYIAAMQSKKSKAWGKAIDNLKMAIVKSTKSEAKLRRASLVEMISIAEGSNNSNLKRSTYEAYLNLEPKSKIKSEILYQLYYLDYEKKKYKLSAENFYKLTADKNIKNKLLIKSSDLALSSLVFLKEDTKILSRAPVLSSKVPSRRVKYIKLARDACYNISLSILSKKEKLTSDINGSLKCLNIYSYSDLKTREKVKYIETKINLSALILDHNSIEKYAKDILNIKGVNQKESNYALERILFVSELKFKFKKAYKTLLKIKVSKVKRADQQLKLGMLAELSGYNSKKHYKSFIKMTKSRYKANEIRIHLALKSKYPWKELSNIKGVLLKTPSLLASALLETFGRFKNFKRAEEFTKYKSIRNTVEGRVLFREGFINSYDIKIKPLLRSVIGTSSNYLISKGVKRRIALLNGMEKYLKLKLPKKDVLSQAYALGRLASEYRRFTDEFIKLPMPKKLTKDQKKKYLENVKRKLAPYNDRMKSILMLSNKIWSHIDNINSQFSLLKRSTYHQKIVIRSQLKKLISQAPVRRQRLIKFRLVKLGEISKPNLKKAWSVVKSNPLDLKLLNNLRGQMTYQYNNSLYGYLSVREQLVKGVIR